MFLLCWPSYLLEFGICYGIPITKNYPACLPKLNLMPQSVWIGRKAKESLFGQDRSFSNGHVAFEKKQQLELDSVVEETVTGDYALIINGHSLVSSLKALFFFFFILIIVFFVLSQWDLLLCFQNKWHYWKQGICNDFLFAKGKETSNMYFIYYCLNHHTEGGGYKEILKS